MKLLDAAQATFGAKVSAMQNKQEFPVSWVNLAKFLLNFMTGPQICNQIARAARKTLEKTFGALP